MAGREQKLREMFDLLRKMYAFLNGEVNSPAKVLTTLFTRKSTAYSVKGIEDQVYAQYDQLAQSFLGATGGEYKNQPNMREAHRKYFLENFHLLESPDEKESKGRRKDSKLERMAA